MLTGGFLLCALVLACGSEVTVQGYGWQGQAASVPTGGAAGAAASSPIGGAAGVGGAGNATTTGSAGEGGAAPTCSTAEDCPESALACRRICDHGLCAEGVSPAGTSCAQCGGDRCDGNGWCVKSDSCETLDCAWSKGLGDRGSQIALGLAADGAGAGVVTGLFDGALDFGGGVLEATAASDPGSYDAFAAEFEPTGAHRWSLAFGSTGFDSAEAVDVDTVGQVLVAGYFGGAISVGGMPLTSVGPQDALVAKLDASGGPLWVLRFGGTGYDAFSDVVSDETGGALLVGHFEGVVDLGGSSLESAAGRDAFAVRLDATGGLEWARSWGGPGHDLAARVARGSGGTFVVAGQFEATVDFGGGPLASAGRHDAFVLVLGAGGEHLGSARYGGEGDELVRGVALGPEGEIALTGRATEPPDIEGDPQCSLAEDGAFWVVTTADGVILSAHCVGGTVTGPLAGVAVAFDADGALYVTGTCDGPSDAGTCQSEGIFLRRQSVLGDTLFETNFDGPPDQTVTSLALDPWGNVFLAGGFMKQFSFGSGTLDACAFDSLPLAVSGRMDVFLAKVLASEVE